MSLKQFFIRSSLFLLALLCCGVRIAFAGEAPCSLDRTSYAAYTVWRADDLIVFTSGMAVDADGSPRAYHPDGVSGLDDLHNAGTPGDWSALALMDGKPLVQGPQDAAPGYYVSMTSLEDHSVQAIVPSRFVDSEQVPYIALPPDLSGPRLGDLAIVINTRNGKSSPAIVADHGPRNRLGEGSIRLAKSLGINSNARTGGIDQGIVYAVFLNSGEHKPLPADAIAQRATQLGDESLDVDEVNVCIAADKESVLVEQ